MTVEAMVRRLDVIFSAVGSNYYHFSFSVENGLERAKDKEREPVSKLLQ